MKREDEVKRTQFFSTTPIQRVQREYKHGIFRDYWGYLREWVIAAIFFSILLGIILGIIFGLIAAERHACHRASHHLSVPSRFDAFAGCYILIDGQWVPADSIRVNEEGR